MTSIQKPENLKHGDTVGIVSPASKIDEKHIKSAVAQLEAHGYNVVVGTYAAGQHHTFAGTDKQRASDLQKMLDDLEIKAILCSRGGYGTLRTLQHVSWDGFKKNPKWVVGFSDITALHSSLHNMGYASIHGVMTAYFTNEGKTSKSLQTLMNALTGIPNNYTFAHSKYNVTGEASGVVVGGNLSVLLSLRGTPSDIDTRGKILFIEDLAEYLYHIDRIMMNLKTGGMLSGLKGLIVGGFAGLKDNDTPFGMSYEEIILDAVRAYNFPVAFNFPAGHQPENHAIKMGCEAKLSVTEKGTEFHQK
ncbi:MAG: LD-carboxypeptidase [Prolixibacteraceae bacterium]|nr:LD-carboxypeptidase [Prolixibacteraceae bacterium]